MQRRRRLRHSLRRSDDVQRSSYRGSAEIATVPGAVRRLRERRGVRPEQCDVVDNRHPDRDHRHVQRPRSAVVRVLFLRQSLPVSAVRRLARRQPSRARQRRLQLSSLLRRQRRIS